MCKALAKVAKVFPSFTVNVYTDQCKAHYLALFFLINVWFNAGNSSYSGLHSPTKKLCDLHTFTLVTYSFHSKLLSSISGFSHVCFSQGHLSSLSMFTYWGIRMVTDTVVLFSASDGSHLKNFSWWILRCITSFLIMGRYQRDRVTCFNCEFRETKWTRKCGIQRTCMYAIFTYRCLCTLVPT